MTRVVIDFENTLAATDIRVEGVTPGTIISAASRMLQRLWENPEVSVSIISIRVAKEEIIRQLSQVLGNEAVAALIANNRLSIVDKAEIAAKLPVAGLPVPAAAPTLAASAPNLHLMLIANKQRIIQEYAATEPRVIYLGMPASDPTIAPLLPQDAPNYFMPISVPVNKCIRPSPEVSYEALKDNHHFYLVELLAMGVNFSTETVAALKRSTYVVHEQTIALFKLLSDKRRWPKAQELQARVQAVIQAVGADIVAENARYNSEPFIAAMSIDLVNQFYSQVRTDLYVQQAQCFDDFIRYFIDKYENEAREYRGDSASALWPRYIERLENFRDLYQFIESNRAKDYFSALLKAKISTTKLSAAPLSKNNYLGLLKSLREISADNLLARFDEMKMTIVTLASAADAPHPLLWLAQELRIRFSAPLTNVVCAFENTLSYSVAGQNSLSPAAVLMLQRLISNKAVTIHVFSRGTSVDAMREQLNAALEAAGVEKLIADGRLVLRENVAQPRELLTQLKTDGRRLVYLDDNNEQFTALIKEANNQTAEFFMPILVPPVENGKLCSHHHLLLTELLAAGYTYPPEFFTPLSVQEQTLASSVVLQHQALVKLLFATRVPLIAQAANTRQFVATDLFNDMQFQRDAYYSLMTEAVWKKHLVNHADRVSLDVIDSFFPGGSGTPDAIKTAHCFQDFLDYFIQRYEEARPFADQPRSEQWLRYERRLEAFIKLCKAIETMDSREFGRMWQSMPSPQGRTLLGLNASKNRYLTLVNSLKPVLRYMIRLRLKEMKARIAAWEPEVGGTLPHPIARLNAELNGAAPAAAPVVSRSSTSINNDGQ